jgi:kynurenine formamidase
VIVKVNYNEGIEINAKHFMGTDVADKAVLIQTDWSDHWQTDAYFENHPFVTEDAAKYLRDNGALLVGIDSYNIDDTRCKRRPVHSILLKEEILIVEHLCNLRSVPDGVNFTFNAVPPKIKGMGAYPVRAYALIK